MKTNNNYKIKKYLTLLFIATIGLSSCKKDFLNRESVLEIPEENIGETAQRIEGQVNGIYATVKSGTLYGGRMLIYNDIRGEEFLNRGRNGVTGYSVYQFINDPSDSYVANFWISGYLTINRVNIFLENIEKVKEGVLTPAQKTQFIAEVKFVRAMAYYALVQLFAKPYAADNGASKGVPLRLLPEKTIANNTIAKATVKEIYDQILKDLTDAEAGVPKSFNSQYLASTRAHTNTVIAFKTRIYLAMKNYPKVIEEANKMVKDNPPYETKTGVYHALLARPESVFRDKMNAERILSFPFELTNIPGTQNQLAYYYNAGNVEYYLNKAAGGIYANPNWPNTDARKISLTDPDVFGFLIITKYTDVDTYLDWAPIIRYAEVLLNLAEAEAEAGSQARALSLLKAIRHRSDPNYQFPAFANKQSLVDAILLERRIELLGEGFRIPDLQRRNSPITSVGAARVIDPSDEQYVFPVPLREVIDNVDINK